MTYCTILGQVRVIFGMEQMLPFLLVFDVAYVKIPTVHHY